jgi:hypothetical protein
MAKRKRTNNDLQNTTHKTKDKATRTPLNTGEILQHPIRRHIHVTFTRSIILPVSKSWK